MDDLTLISELLNNVGQFGISIIFLWLFMREANAHDKTREAYRQDLRERPVTDDKQVNNGLKN
jgi:hypothetical protein